MIPHQQSTLADILKSTLLPWVERDGVKNLFTAYPAWRGRMEMPEAMTATRKPILGARVPASRGRPYGKASVVEANWPEDGLCSARTPKLSFILAGPLALQIADYVVHCQPGHLILLPAGVPFGNAPVSDHSSLHQGIYEMLQMMPYHGGLICWLSRRQYDDSSRPHVQESTCSIPHSRVPFYLNQLVDEALKNQPHQQLVCDSLLKIALAFLQRELQELPVLQTGEIHDAQLPVPSEYRAYSIKHAQEYIENNLRESLSIEKVARYVCMSRTVFTERFRAKTEKTFSQYVQDLRFEEACKLLSGSDLAVKHVAAAVGLQPNRMRTLFHERKNTSPLQYRNSYRTSEK